MRILNNGCLKLIEINQKELVIADMIMKNHKGRVWAQAHVNKGATFFVELL